MSLHLHSIRQNVATSTTETLASKTLALSITPAGHLYCDALSTAIDLRRHACRAPAIRRGTPCRLIAILTTGHYGRQTRHARMRRRRGSSAVISNRKQHRSRNHWKRQSRSSCAERDLIKGVISKNSHWAERVMR